jgi:hypothetical protein
MHDSKSPIISRANLSFSFDISYVTMTMTMTWHVLVLLPSPRQRHILFSHSRRVGMQVHTYGRSTVKCLCGYGCVSDNARELVRRGGLWDVGCGMWDGADPRRSEREF